MPDLDAAIVTAIAELTEGMDDSTNGTLADVARRLDLADQLKLAAQQIIDQTTESMTDRMEQPTYALSGVGLFCKKSSKRSAWATDRSAKEFRRDVFASAERHALDAVNAVDRETGEIDPLMKAAVRNVTSILDESLMSFSNVKKNAWRELDLTEDDYRTVVWSNQIEIQRGIEMDG